MNIQIYKSTGYPHFANQDGVALVVSLLVLLIVTLLSVSAMTSTTIDTKISINHQFKQITFQTAENALAKLLGVNYAVGLTIPAATVENTSAESTNYFTSTGVDQVGTSADMELTFVNVSTPGQYKYTGYDMSTESYIFQADAIGRIANTKVRTTNRMIIARPRKSQNN